MVIIAPHADDEVIGCFTKLHLYRDSVETHSIEPALVLFPDQFQMEDAAKSSNFFLFNVDIFGEYGIPHKEKAYFFPDPYFELHPTHRRLGAVGERWARMGFDVTFYSTNMNAPYIHEIRYPEEKKDILDQIYTKKSDLWRYDHKYWLFEGYCKWIFR